MALIKPSDLMKPSKPLMLRDYLLDDLSSCSSSGFKSYPRRQCCAAVVGFLVEIDSTKPILTARRTTSETASYYSALHKASTALLSAVRRLALPLPPPPQGYRSVTGNSVRRINLSRLFSMKALMRRRKSSGGGNDGEIRRWRSFGEFLEEPLELSGPIIDPCYTFTTEPTITSSSVSKSKSSCAGGDIDLELSPSRISDRDSSSQINDGEGENDSNGSKTVGESLGVPVGGDSSVNDGNNQKEWRHDAKEQFSPVSVLDCPFEDDEEETHSPYLSISCLAGARQRPKQHARRFDGIAKLEPVDLDERLVQVSKLNDGFDDYPPREEEEEIGKRAEELLGIIRSRSSASDHSLISNSENLLSDFLGEGVKGNIRAADLIKAVEIWVADRQELFVGWKVKEKRIDYLRDIEKGGWRDLDEGRDKIVEELEASFFGYLVEELVFELVR